MNEIKKEGYDVPADAYNCVDWKDVFVLNPGAKSGISYKHGTIEKPVGTILKGNNGGMKSRGWQVSYKRKLYLVHRIVYILANGHLANDCFIDHKDGDALNNTPSNLRTVSYRENCQNRGMSQYNSSGYTGVLKFTVTNRQGKEYQYWRASWYDKSGKIRMANYSIAKYGYELAQSNAIKRRELEISLLNLEGMGYTDRHGKAEDNSGH